MEWLTSPETWIALLTLTVLEIVLGIDNIIFVSILAGKLPAGEQPRARTVGLTLAMVTRILLLLSLTGIMRLTRPLFSPFGHPFSGRDLILLLGGLFLLWKSTREIHDKLEGEEGQQNVKAGATFGGVIVQIALLGDYRRGYGPAGRRDDRRHRARGARHARGRRPDQRLRAPSPDLEDARAVLPAAHRRHAHRRRPWPTHPEGLRLFRDGLLRVRRVAQPAPAAQGAARAPEGVDHPVTRRGVALSRAPRYRAGSSSPSRASRATTRPRSSARSRFPCPRGFVRTPGCCRRRGRHGRLPR